MLDELLVAIDVAGVELRNLGEETLVVVDVVEMTSVGKRDPVERVDRL